MSRYAVAWCFSCRKVLGPDLAGAVGETAGFDHPGHKVRLIDVWEADDGPTVDPIDNTIEIIPFVTDEELADLYIQVREEAKDRELPEVDHG